MNISYFSNKVLKNKHIDFDYNQSYVDYFMGEYDIAKILYDICTITKSKMCSLTCVQIDKGGNVKYVTAYNTDPQLSMCQDHPLYQEAVVTKQIIISNDLKKDPRSKKYEGQCPVKKLCCIPIIHENIVYGQILLANRESNYHSKLIERISVQLNMVFGIVVSMDEKSTESQTANYQNEKFLHVMSHGMRTFIHSIVSMTSLLKKSKNLTDLQHEYTNRILESCENLVGNVSDCLDLQKLKCGSLEIENVLFDLKDLLENAISFFLDKALKKNLYLNLDIEKDVPKNIYGDSKRIKQILINLLSNSLRNTEDGGIVVSVKIKGQLLQFSVRDTGTGISQNHLQHIFDDYFQVDPTSVNGMGLGLCICKRLVRIMGGDISVISMTNPPTGSIFTFTLPLAQNIHENIEISHDFKVIIVDPIESQRITLREYMNYWNIDHAIVSTIKEAKKICSYKSFDIVMVDVSKNFSGALGLLKMLPNSKAIALNQDVELDGFDGYVKKNLAKIEVYNALVSVKNKKQKPFLEIPRKENKNLKICVVEDDENSAYALKQILITLDVEPDNITFFDSGEKIVNCVNHKIFDIIFIDCRLNGEMNGIVATKLILDKYNFIKVYGISAELSDNEKSQWIESGIDGLLMKPFTLDDVESIISK